MGEGVGCWQNEASRGQVRTSVSEVKRTCQWEGLAQRKPGSISQGPSCLPVALA